MLTTILVGIVLLLFGIAFCFYGYKAFMVLLPVVGFIVGFYAGAQAMQIALDEGFLATTLSVVVGLGAGILGAFGAYVIFIMGIILIAGIVGFAVTAGIFDLLGVDNSCIASLIGLAFAAGGVWLTLRYKLVRYVIIVFTAIIGADAIILSVLLFLNRITVEEITAPGGIFAPVFKSSPLFIIIFLALFGAGVYIQWVASRDFNFEDIKLFERWSPTNR